MFHTTTPTPKGNIALARLILIGMLFTTAVPCAIPDDHSEIELTRESQLKAAFLWNFTKFVKWPANEKNNADSFLNFCLIGLTSVDSALERIIEGKKVKGRTPTIKNLANINQVKGCHVLFISKSEQNTVTKLMETLGNSRVLTVSETPGFAQQGGAIEFIVVANKLSFAINLEAAKRARLELSSELLKLAKIVRDG